jgi:hypothetical protein
MDYPGIRSPMVLVAAVVLAANLLFFALTLFASSETPAIIDRIEAAYRTGDLDQTEYLWWDSRRGWHQYNDCLVLQLISNENSSRLQRALAPTFFSEGDGKCSVLYALRVEREIPSEMSVAQYARYWHGPAVVAVFGLRFLELSQFRRVIAGIVWLTIGILALAALRAAPYSRLTGLAIAFAAATFWAVPYFGPGLTHAPGDAVLILALAALVAKRGMSLRINLILPFAAAFGAVIVFFEMLTGQLPIAGALLMAVVLSANRDARLQGHDGVSAPFAAVASGLAFGVGAIATVVTKQILAWGLTVPKAVGQFVSQLGYYMAAPDYEQGWPGLLEPFGRLVQKSAMLTYGNQLAGYVLVGAIGVVLLLAGTRGWQLRHSDQGRDMLILVGLALTPAIWVLILPHHTYIHAAFMVRILVVPIALAPAAFLWPRLSPPATSEQRKIPEVAGVFRRGRRHA